MHLAGAFASLWLALAGPTSAEPLNYGAGAHWVCRPGDDGPCKTDLTTARIRPDGTEELERFAPATDPAIDCFYVYPTVSNAPGLSAPGLVGEDERRAVRQQFARFGRVCRLFAPAYRQITATSMKLGYQGRRLEGVPAARELAQNDVLDAWRWYMAHENRGRGVVLIGHSQGAGILAELIRREIDGKPAQAQLVSAILPGSFVLAPPGKDVGETFQAIPACRRAGQTGCVIVFNAYRAGSEAPPGGPPPFPSGSRPLCTNPANLTGGPGVLKPYLSTAGETIIPDFSGPQGAWTRNGKAPAAPFVAFPLQAECRTDGRGPHLAVGWSPEAHDARTGAFTGDWLVEGKLDPIMGLHLIDLNLAMGDLLEIVEAQGRAFAP